MLEILKCSGIGIIFIVATVSLLGGFVWCAMRLQGKFYEPNKHRIPRLIPLLGNIVYAAALAAVILYSVYNVGRSFCERPRPHPMTRGNCGPS